LARLPVAAISAVATISAVAIGSLTRLLTGRTRGLTGLSTIRLTGLTLTTRLRNRRRAAHQRQGNNQSCDAFHPSFAYFLLEELTALNALAIVRCHSDRALRRIGWRKSAGRYTSRQTQ